jgi:hypothetical protein
MKRPDSKFLHDLLFDGALLGKAIFGCRTFAATEECPAGVFSKDIVAASSVPRNYPDFCAAS